MLRGSWNEKIICRRAVGHQKGWPDMFTLFITSLLSLQSRRGSSVIIVTTMFLHFM